MREREFSLAAYWKRRMRKYPRQVIIVFGIRTRDVRVGFSYLYESQEQQQESNFRFIFMAACRKKATFIERI